MKTVRSNPKQNNDLSQGSRATTERIKMRLPSGDDQTATATGGFDGIARQKTFPINLIAPISAVRLNNRSAPKATPGNILKAPRPRTCPQMSMKFVYGRSAPMAPENKKRQGRRARKFRFMAATG
jgi:hypothetical protein